jgi:hypothetical protein
MLITGDLQMAIKKTVKKNEPQAAYVILEDRKKWFGLSKDTYVYFVTSDKAYAKDVMSSKVELGDDVRLVEVWVAACPAPAKKPRAKRAS